MAPRACGTPQPLAALGCPCRCAFVPHGHTKGSQGVSNDTTRARTTCPDSETVNPKSWTLHGPCPESEAENPTTRKPKNPNPENPKTRKPEIPKSRKPENPKTRKLENLKMSPTSHGLYHGTCPE